MMLCPFQMLFPWHQPGGRGNIPIWRMKKFGCQLVESLHNISQSVHGLLRLNPDLSDGSPLEHTASVWCAGLYLHSLPFVSLKRIFKNIFLITTSQGMLLLTSHLTWCTNQKCSIWLLLSEHYNFSVAQSYILHQAKLYFTKYSSISPALGCTHLTSPIDASQLPTCESFDTEARAVWHCLPLELTNWPTNDKVLILSLGVLNPI